MRPIAEVVYDENLRLIPCHPSHQPSIFEAMNENLADKDYLIGDFSAADLMLGHSCFMANRLGCVSEEMQNIKDYVARINARPAFQKAITMGE